MIIYHTIRLTNIGKDRTIILDLETLESQGKKETVFSVLDDYNKKGYILTAVSNQDYFLTKRVD